MKLIGALLTTLVMSVTVSAQSMPTREILTRTTMIETSYGRGSVFSIDVDGREYWITAKHLLNGAQHPPYGSVSTKSAKLSVLDEFSPRETWTPITFKVIDPGKDIDIVVLAAGNPILTNPLPNPPTSSEGATMGADCEFLGYPYGGAWRVMVQGQAYWMPIAKHCTFSNIPLENSVAMPQSLSPGDQRIWVLDGINNPGFSGGPVIFNTGASQKIVAVVSGYILEPADVILAPRTKAPKKTSTQSSHPKEQVEVNSGFIVAWDIKYAVEAINKNPIGPLRSASR